MFPTPRDICLCLGRTRGLPNVAFRNPDGTIALVLVNTRRRGQGLRLAFGEKSAYAFLPGRSVATFVWQQP